MTSARDPSTKGTAGPGPAAQGSSAQSSAAHVPPVQSHAAASGASSRAPAASVRNVRVTTTPAYDVKIGAGVLAAVEEASRGRSARAVVSDTNVSGIYRAACGLSTDVPWFDLEPGEESKSFRALERVLEFFVASRLDRQSVVVAVGGGVVGDLAGMAAALYMRGIPYVQVPTTLLSQVDSSVGGKTAVNLVPGKNLAGAFHQPSLVLADTSTLATLSDDEYRSGLGEVVKTAILNGDVALQLLERESKRILARDPAVMADVVEICVRTKAHVVSRDPNEKGPRKLLNLGHTFAHAIEHVAGFGKVPHGVAVGVGVALAFDASRRMKRLAEPELEARVLALFDAFAMPRSLRALRVPKLDATKMTAAMSHDKKSVAGRVRLVLPVCAGSAIFDVDADVETLRAVIDASLAG